MSEDPNFSIEWHKGFQIGLYSGISKEQERIIKLLESIEDYPPGWDYNDEIASVIAIIKGENK
jgi:hypothetical protein